jgi:hypothetical protein
LIEFKETGKTHHPLYGIFKNNVGIGMMIPYIIKEGKYADAIALRSVKVGKKYSRVYYIMNVNENGDIEDGSPVTFDVSSEIRKWD